MNERINHDKLYDMTAKKNGMICKILERIWKQLKRADIYAKEIPKINAFCPQNRDPHHSRTSSAKLPTT